MNAVAFRLAFAQAASGLIGGAATPFLGAWFAWKGLSPQEIGALFAIGMLLRVPIVPLTGIAADARNDRRGMLLLLCGTAALFYGAVNLVSSPSLIFVTAVPASIALAAMSPLLESVCVRLAGRFGFDYGHVRLWASSAFVLGNVVAGAAIWKFGLVIVAPWLVVSVSLNVFAVYALPAPPPDHPRQALGPRMRATWEEAGELIRSPVFLLFLAAASLDQGSHAFYYAYGVLHWRALGYSDWFIGLVWPLGVLAEIGFLSISLKLFRRVGAVRLLLLGGISCVLRWTILSFDPPLPVLIFAQILHGGTFALAHLGAMYFVLQAVPPKLAATAQSLYAMCSAGLAMSIATSASGALYTAHGGHTYLLMAAMGAGATVFAVLLGAAWSGERITRDTSEEALETI